MATPAVTTEFTVVDVIGSMAIGALLAKGNLRSQRPQVTVFAIDFAVCSLEFEVRLRIVVE